MDKKIEKDRSAQTSTPDDHIVGEALKVFKIQDVQAAYATAFSGDLFIAIFFGPTQAAAVANILFRCDTIARNNHKQVSILTIVCPGAPMPDAAARKALSDAYKYATHEGIDVQGAIVFAEDGIKATIVRNIVLGISIFANMVLPIRVFSKIDEASAWLAPRLNSLAPTGGSLVHGVVSEMTRRHTALTAIRPSHTPPKANKQREQ